MKRERRPDQEGVGFARSDALVGMPARSGATMLLENDRVRVFETALDPGESSEPRRCLDTAIYVVDGGRVRIRTTCDGQSVVGEDCARESVSGHWQAAAEGYSIENAGEGRYRELSVEIK